MYDTDVRPDFIQQSDMFPHSRYFLMRLGVSMVFVYLQLFLSVVGLIAIIIYVKFVSKVTKITNERQFHESYEMDKYVIIYFFDNITNGQTGLNWIKKKWYWKKKDTSFFQVDVSDKNVRHLLDLAEISTGFGNSNDNLPALYFIQEKKFHSLAVKVNLSDGVQQEALEDGINSDFEYLNKDMLEMRFEQRNNPQKEYKEWKTDEGE